MTYIPKPDFEKIVKASGVPTDAESWKAVLKDEADAQESNIANNSKWSPFWRLIEALVVSSVVWMINALLIKHVLPNMFVATAAGKWLDLWAWQFNLERKAATTTQGIIEFSRSATKGPLIVIPAGTWIQTEPINGTVYRVQVLVDTELAENETSVIAKVAAEGEGAAYNLGDGYYHILPTAIPGIAGAQNPANWLSSPGADQESDDELRLRVRNQFSAVANWHIDAVYRALLTKRAGINNDNVYFEHNAPRGPGTANGFILLDTGEPSQEMLDDLNNYVKDQGQHGHGDDLLLQAMPRVDVDITCSLWPVRSLTQEQREQLKTQVELFIGAAMRENTDYKATRTEPVIRFSFSRLAQELHAEFDGIQSLEFDNKDIPNGMDVPRINTLEVTLEAA